MPQKEHPTAVFAASDILAIAAIYKCRLAGLSIPSDIIVTGSDSVNISQTTSPPTTTINRPKYQMDYMARESLAEKLDTPGAKLWQVLLSIKLVIRESTQRQRTQHQNIPNQEAYFGVKLDPEERPALAERL